MARYSKLQENEIRALAIQYNLELINFTSIEGGAGNSSFLLSTAQGEFILTVFEISINRVVNLSKLLGHLEEYEFPTTRWIHRIEGGPITTHQGKPVLIKPYISGQVVRNSEDIQLTQIGNAMAHLHQIPAPDYLPDKHDYGLETFPRAFGHHIDPEFEDWLKQKYDFLRKSILPELPTGLIHGDLFYDNILFDGKQFKAIIDFEEACHYCFVFDLGMGIVGLCAEGTSINLPKVRALISGYQQIRVLEEREKAALQLMVAYAAAATSSWRFWKYNLDTPMPEKANLHRAMMQIAKDANSIPKEKFLELVNH